jgi:single-stranded-DNA-specific exonuclease
MQTLTKHWHIETRLSAEAEHNLAGYHPVMRQILFNRSCTTHEKAREFLEARSPEGTHPLNMLGIASAVDRIKYAIQHNEQIAVYGDYDADGVTATALLTQALHALNAQVIPYIPNRFDEGYGVNKEALEALKTDGVKLVVTVDCGIRSLEEAAYARLLGLDLIVSDHHHPFPELPDAVAIINPKRPGDSYPEKDLAGVGLAYKLVSALLDPDQSSLDDPGNPSLVYLDLVALGTVADLAPLIGENRALVRSGLHRMRQPLRQGLLALMGVAGINPRQISSTDIGFGLGPRLNAAGRLESAQAALNLLLSDDLFESGRLAQELENQNRQRQQITRDTQARAEELAFANDPDALLLFAIDPDFNPGVVGLAASRLTEQYYRPAIVAQRGEDFTRGSCRSIKEFHITEALDQCADLLVRHGGHAAAAGFTVRNENLAELNERLKSLARDQLSQHVLRPTLVADLEIPLVDLRPEILEHLDWLQPTGYGNRQAAFVSRGLRVTSSRTVGKENSHLKLTVTDGRIHFDAIAFRQGHWREKMPPRVDILYTFERNEYNGRISLQLNVRDIKPADTPD